jgi:hypothetical protein
MYVASNSGKAIAVGEGESDGLVRKVPSAMSASKQCGSSIRKNLFYKIEAKREARCSEKKQRLCQKRVLVRTL